MQKKSKLIIIIALVAVIIIAAVIIIPGLSKNSGNKTDSNNNSTVINSDGENESDSENNLGNEADVDIGNINNINIGDTYIFGSYEQDNNIENGKEPIEWIVLDKQDSKILVISKYALDSKAFNEERIETSWENCTLRTWLNSTFINQAFSSKEQAYIPTVTITPEISGDNSFDIGNSTQDKIFHLSTSEAERYLPDAENRKCQATPWAVANEIEVVGDYCYWGLRSHRNSLLDVDHISSNGLVAPGNFVHCYFIGVRPAMWIDFAA